MHWSSADTLEVEIPLRGSETALSSIEVPGAGRVTLAPVALPYSPEYKPAGGEEGESALARLAQATGGKERIDLSGVWRDLPRKMRMIELAPWLLILAALLLLVEVWERHSGLITLRLLPSLERAGRAGKRRVEIKKNEAKQPQSVEEPKSEIEQEEAPVEKAEPAEILDALQQARQQAKERIRNKRK
jgi:hypothetical protein